jgi:hypothetical protein
MEFDGAVQRVSRKTRQHIMPCAMPESVDRCATRSIAVQHVEQRRSLSNMLGFDDSNISNLLEFDGMRPVEHGRTLSSSIEPGRTTCRICSSSMECGQWSMVELDLVRSNLVEQHVESARVRWNVACREWSNSIELDRTLSCNMSNLLEFDGMWPVEHGRTR